MLYGKRKSFRISSSPIQLYLSVLAKNLFADVRPTKVKSYRAL